MATGHPWFAHHFGHVLDKDLAWRDETRKRNPTASRARRKVQSGPAVPESERARHREVVNFFAASEAGDFEALGARPRRRASSRRNGCSDGRSQPGSRCAEPFKGDPRGACRVRGLQGTREAWCRRLSTACRDPFGLKAERRGLYLLLPSRARRLLKLTC